MKKKIIVLLVFIVAAILAYNYVFQSHRNIETEKAEFTVTSIEIINEFSIDPIKSEKKYLNKTIEITGKITEQSEKVVSLDNMVFCQFTNHINTVLKNNTQIKVKGRFIGFDDLVEEIKLDQCIIN